MAYNTRRSGGFNMKTQESDKATPPTSEPPPSNINEQKPEVKNESLASDTQPAFTTQAGYNAQKSETQPSTPLSEENVRAEVLDSCGGSREGGKTDSPKSQVSPIRPWKKGAMFRVSKKIRKRRQNAKLRQMLTPKNAMMVLHELHPELKIAVSEQVNAANQMVYTVDIEIDGKTHRGQGMSKLAAKQAGCENALKAILVEKMAALNKSSPPQSNEESPATTEPMDVTSQTETDSTPNQEDGDSDKKVRKIPEDDVPWGSLASFALYKLFSDWQAQGFQIPTTTSSIPLSQKSHDGSVTTILPMKKIPEDANQKHPVQLLNQLRPGSQYSETREGTPPNLTFTFTVVIDEKTYTGSGNSKKEAKKECAKAALEAMGVVYD